MCLDVEVPLSISDLKTITDCCKVKMGIKEHQDSEEVMKSILEKLTCADQVTFFGVFPELIQEFQFKPIALEI